MTEEGDRHRETIAFGGPIKWDDEAKYGVVFFSPEKAHQFPPLPVWTIETLIEAGYLDSSYRHNQAPPAERLLEWAASVQRRFKENQFEVGLTGYMVSPEREDSRIVLTGISIRSPGPIPESLKREVGREFTADLLSVDDFQIRVEWD
jgi:hypothetical protein